METKKIIKIILITVISLILIDQVSKILVTTFITDDIILLQNVFAISKVQNDISRQNITNIVIMVLFLVVVIRFVIVQKHNLKKSTILFLSMIIAGMISNVLDIIFRGGTFAFIQLSDFPVFNLADCFIVIGWILFIVNLFRKIRDV